MTTQSKAKRPVTILALALLMNYKISVADYALVRLRRQREQITIFFILPPSRIVVF